MNITVQNADFSALGLGSTDWVLNWCYKVGITDPAKKAAYQALYSQCVAAGIWSSLDAIMPFAEDTQAKQAYLFDNLDTPRQLTFLGTPAFSAAGFNPNGAGAAQVPFVFSEAVFSRISMGVFNSTAESHPSSGNRYLIRGLSNGSGSWSCEFARDYQSSNSTTLGVFTTPGNFSYTTYLNNASKTGFLQYVRDGNVATLIDDAVEVGSNAPTTAPVGGGTRGFVLGGNESGNAGFSMANQKFAYIGKLTVAQAKTFNTIVKTFLTAVGR